MDARRCGSLTVAAGEQGQFCAVFVPVREFGVVIEGGRAILMLRRQGDPQLCRVQLLAVVQRILGVGDAMSSGHQIDLARADDLLVAQAVAVQDLALDQPGEGLQADVRVRADVHALAGLEPHGAGVIEEAPRVNHALLAIGERTAHEHAIAEVGAARLDADDRIHGRCL